MGPLLALVQGAGDLFAKAAAIEALGRIGDESVRPALADIAKTGSVLLRGKAEEALKAINHGRETS